MTRTRCLLAAVSVLSLGACVVGPDYQRPSAVTPPAFKEAAGWKSATPADTLDRGAWWELYGDPLLNDLERRVEVSNQNLAAAEAAYRQARAAIGAARAQYFPTLGASGSANVSKGSGSGTTITNPDGTTTTTGGGVNDSYQIGLDAAWAPDLWGRIRRTVEGARANAQASEADLASARLSAQASLAIAYIQLRATDEDRRLLDETIAAYRESLRVTQNRYDQGVVARGEVLSAQSQVETAQAEAAADDQIRAQLEHAIAVLAGEAPANFSIAKASWSLTTPEIPVTVPSVLLERRPDIAAAERRVAAANAQIGVQQAAYYPTLNLSGGVGPAAGGIGSLLNTSSLAWSLGASLAGTIFDAGARRSAVEQARAVWEQQVALYRQTVLTAFQEVEDQLSAMNSLASQEQLRRSASANADRAEQIALNQYKAGVTSRLDLFVAQTTALSARRTALSTSENRLVASVSLIQALGGGWTGLDLETPRPATAIAQP
jgi:NodT family efflux transporter outer membrane factor (OMF) lipoprotein